MYAIIHKNKVITGPKAWDRAFFLSKLKGLDKMPTLPRLAPKIIPFIIDEDTKIVSAKVNVDSINPMVQYLTGPLWEIQEDAAIASYVATDTPIEQAKGNFRSQAADERYKKETAGTKATVQGIEVSLDTTRDGRNIFLQALVMMADDATINWKFPETWLTITKPELTMIVQTGAAHIQQCFDWENEINSIIDQAQTAEELLAIEIVDNTTRPQRGE